MADTEKRSNKALVVLLLLVAAFVGFAVVDFVEVGVYSNRDQEFLKLSAQQSLISQSMVRYADLAVTGNQDAFQQLLNARDEFDTSINLMGNGDPQTLMPAASGEVLSEVNVLQSQWGTVRGAVQVILSAHDSVLVANQAATSIRQTMPDLLKSWDSFADEANKRNAGHNTVYYAAKQGYYGQTILRDVNQLTTGGHGDVSAIAQELPDTIQNFTRITRGMLDGNPQLGLTAVTD